MFLFSREMEETAYPHIHEIRWSISKLYHFKMNKDMIGKM
jgi:hypothetical protein